LSYTGKIYKRVIFRKVAGKLRKVAGKELKVAEKLREVAGKELKVAEKLKRAAEKEPAASGYTKYSYPPHT
jgi:hypothetical protein